MPALTLKAFGKCVLKSGLLRREALEKFASEFQETHGSLTSKKLAQHLVAQKALTVYQAKRLLNGRSEGFFLGGCRILDRLGEGGMGVVYLAQQERLDRRVALKVLPAAQTANSDVLKRFYREAKAAAKLKHANIVQVFDVDQQDGTHFIVMELINGKNLSELLKSEGVFPVGQALNLIRQAAEGLSHAHSSGVIHRDIKPANLVLEDSTLKILDLGLARHESDEKLTGDQTIMGTLDYMSPEQCQDTAGVDHRSDIYSLGCTLYHLLVGQPPFADRPQTGKLLSHVTEPLPLLHQQNAAIPESIDRVIQRMTAKSLLDRYQAADELIADLDALNDESNLETIIGEIPGLEEVGANAVVSNLSEPSSAIPSLSDDDAANSNTVIRSPVAAGWNFALLIPVMAALVLAGVYMGIQLLKDQRSQEKTEQQVASLRKNESAENDLTQERSGTLPAFSGRDLQSKPAVASEELPGTNEELTGTSEEQPQNVPDEASKEDIGLTGDGNGGQIEMVDTNLQQAKKTDQTHPDSAVESGRPEEQLVVSRPPHETVLRSFSKDWQQDLVSGDILTLISQDTYELTEQVSLSRDLTIQGTNDKRALIYAAFKEPSGWALSNCALQLRHVDVFVDASAATAFQLFALNNADLSLNDVSITILDGGRQTWEDLCVVGVTGAREWDVEAKGASPKPLRVDLQKVFVRGPGALVRNSSTNSEVSLKDCIISGTGPVLHALHQTEFKFKHQGMGLQVKSSTLAIQQPVFAIDCRPFELRPVPMRVQIEASVVATQIPSQSQPVLIEWISPIDRSLVADAFGFVGISNAYVGRGEMFVAGQKNGATQILCQMPVDWKIKKLGEDNSLPSFPPRRSSKRIVWQAQAPRDFRTSLLSSATQDLERFGAETRDIKTPRKFRAPGR